MTEILELQVRPATSSDVEHLVEFNRSMAVETEDRELGPELVEHGVRAVLKDGARGTYFVCESDGRVLGALLLTREWSDWRNGWFFWIQSVYTHPEARRRGVYRALHEYVLGRARASTDVVGIRLYVDARNRAAMETYARLGMAPTEYRVYEVDFVMGG